MNRRLADKLKTLPRSPGVYFHKSSNGEVIYVGKAAVLKNRVRQYFQSKKDMDAKTLALVGEIADTDWIETESEIDALFLESEMIKRYKPRFNILLRDDKSQTYVRINLRDDWPHLGFTRQPADDGSKYYGPFYNAATVKKALRILRKIFPYYTKPVASLRANAKQSSQNIDAGLPRYARNDSKLEQQIGLVPTAEISSAEYKKSLRQLISYIKGNRQAIVAQIEKNMKIAASHHDYELAACYRNQLFNLVELKKQIVFGRDEFLDVSRDQGLIELRDMLNLPKIPRRIEAYDISHHGGTNNTASMVVATNGLADRAQYRKFKLHLSGNDDYAHMRETLIRRLRHLKDWGRPDLIILDGGAGQLSAVADLLNAEGIPVIGRSKSGDHARNAAMQVVIPTKNGHKLIRLDSQNHAAKLIARLDDEAHRFAVSYHTALKRSGQIKNELEQIAGIGPATRKKLIKHFGSLTAVKQADLAEIAKIIGKNKANLLKLSKGKL